MNCKLDIKKPIKFLGLFFKLDEQRFMASFLAYRVWSRMVLEGLGNLVASLSFQLLLFISHRSYQGLLQIIIHQASLHPSFLESFVVLVFLELRPIVDATYAIAMIVALTTECAKTMRITALTHVFVYVAIA